MKSFKALLTVKQELDNARRQGNDELEYTGGEPTIYPYILETVEFAKQLGFKTQRIITNGLAGKQKYKKLFDKGVKQFLLSIHGYKDTLTAISQVPKHWEQLEETIEVLKECGADIFANVTLMKQNTEELKKITEYCVEKKFNGINYINWNEHYTTQTAGQKEHKFQQKISVLAPKLMEAIDIAMKNNLWVNVRYFPMCAVKKVYRKYFVNNPIYLFDDLEWAPINVIKSQESYEIYNRNLQYQINNQDNEKCRICGIRNVCGGVNKAYLKNNGNEELVVQNEMIDYPMHYRKDLYHIDIVILMYKMNKDITTLLAELVTKTKPPYTIHLIHNYDGAVNNRNRGLANSNNHPYSKYIAMLDDDIFSLPFNWNKRMIDKLKYNPERTVISARLMNEDGSPGPNSANNYDFSKDLVEVSMVPTACCVFRWDNKTKFNEKMIRAGWEDTLFFTQLKGKKFIDNTIQVIHSNLERESGGADNNYNKEVFQEIHQGN